MEGLLQQTADGRLAIGECVLEEGALIEVLWRGQWMRGRLEYLLWNGRYRLCTGEWRLDVRAGMRARGPSSPTLLPGGEGGD